MSEGIHLSMINPLCVWADLAGETSHNQKVAGRYTGTFVYWLRAKIARRLLSAVRLSLATGWTSSEVLVTVPSPLESMQMVALRQGPLASFSWVPVQPDNGLSITPPSTGKRVGAPFGSR